MLSKQVLQIKKKISDISSTLQLLKLTFQENSVDHLFLKGAFDNFDFSVLSKGTILKNQARWKLNYRLEQVYHWSTNKA